MPAIIEQVGISTGRTDVGILYRDQLIDPGCISLLDFNHKWGYAAMATPVAANTNMRNYRRSGNVAIVAGTPAWSGGMLIISGAATQVALGTEWKLPSTCSHFAIGGFMKVPLSGFTINGTGTTYASLFGWSQTNGSNTQYGLRALYDKATGLANNIYLSMNGVVVDIKSVIPTDGLVHHYAFEMYANTSNTFQIKVYIDGILVYTSTAQTWSGSLVVPSSSAPYIGAYGNNTDAKGAVGRLWLWDLTVAGSKTITDLIIADITQNPSRFS
jgi:hypothetical protein